MYSVYADLRDKKGVKDMDVSRALGFHPSVISDWKRGKATPKYDKLKLIADFFVNYNCIPLCSDASCYMPKCRIVTLFLDKERQL